MEREQFTFYRSFYSAIRRIRKAADRAAAYDAVIGYALTGDMPDLDKLPDGAAVAFEVARPILDASRRKAESGKKGGAKPETAEVNASKAEANRSKPQAKPETAEARGNRKQEKEQVKDQVKEQEKEKVKEQMLYTPSHVPPARTEIITDGQDDGFTAFWAAYPKKTGSIDRAYFEYRRALSAGVEAQKLLEAIQWQAEEWDKTQESRFMPSAENWLHNRGWEAKKVGIGPRKSKAEELAEMGRQNNRTPEELDKLLQGLERI